MDTLESGVKLRDLSAQPLHCYGLGCSLGWRPQPQPPQHVFRRETLY